MNPKLSINIFMNMLLFYGMDFQSDALTSNTYRSSYCSKHIEQQRFSAVKLSGLENAMTVIC